MQSFGVEVQRGEGMIKPSEVHESFLKCLYKEDEITNGEIPEDSVRVEGVSGNFGFNPTRLEEQREKVVAWLSELPEEFKEGWTFLNGCMQSDGVQWGEQSTVDQLFTMSIGLKLGSYLMAREMWSAFPGGMPYFQIGSNAPITPA